MPNEVRYAYTLSPITTDRCLNLASYSEDILPPLEIKKNISNTYIPSEEYRDPSDEDVRKKIGFKV